MNSRFLVCMIGFALLTCSPAVKAKNSGRADGPVLSPFDMRHAGFKNYSLAPISPYGHSEFLKTSVFNASGFQTPVYSSFSSGRVTEFGDRHGKGGVPIKNTKIIDKYGLRSEMVKPPVDSGDAGVLKRNSIRGKANHGQTSLSNDTLDQPSSFQSRILGSVGHSGSAFSNSQKLGAGQEGLSAKSFFNKGSVFGGSHKTTPTGSAGGKSLNESYADHRSLAFDGTRLSLRSDAGGDHRGRLRSDGSEGYGAHLKSEDTRFSLFKSKEEQARTSDSVLDNKWHSNWSSRSSHQEHSNASSPQKRKNSSYRINWGN